MSTSKTNNPIFYTLKDAFTNSGKYSDVIDNELLKNLVIPPGLYVKKVHPTPPIHICTSASEEYINDELFNNLIHRAKYNVKIASKTKKKTGNKSNKVSSKTKKIHRNKRR